MGAWATVTGVGIVYGCVGVGLFLWMTVIETDIPRAVMASYVCLVALALCVIAIFLTVSAIRLLLVLERPEDATSFSFYFFKLKLTRCILIFNIVLAPSLVVILMNALQLISTDIFSVYVSVAVTSPATCFMAIAFGTITFITLIHTQKVKEVYTCCQKTK